MKFWYLILAGCIFSFSANAQNNLWTEAGTATKEAFRNIGRQGFPQQLRLVRLNRALAATSQAMAPVESTGRTKVAGASFDIPLPDGSFLSAAILETKVLSPQLSQQYSQIKTYQLVEPGSTKMLGKLTITPEGVNGIVFTESGTIYISPVGGSYPDVHMVYATKDVEGNNRIICGVNEALQQGSKNPQESNQLNVALGDCQLRTYRLAISTTGEYTFWAGGQAGAIAAATVTVNNVSAIFERDAAIRFTIVTNNSLIYTDSILDPFAASASPDGNDLINNHSVQVSALGSGGFDLGMVFHRGWNGGLAATPSVCNAGSKGYAASGLNFGTGSNPIQGPQGSLFDGVVAHEIAHQFSARHSFGSTNPNCSPHVNAPTAWEPGGGSTLMAYAGVCAPNSYQNNTDLYFHGGSISQIVGYATSGSGSCAVTSPLSNSAPTVTVSSNSYTIPISTPFSLNAFGTDTEQTSLQYNWEQLDAGTGTLPPSPTAVSGPNFRSFPYRTASSRTFPRIQDIVAGISPAYEVLPSVTRTMNFRVTVRDAASGGGCTALENIAINTTAAAGPFVVTSQSSPTSWVANGSNTATITWNVAGTNAAPVNTANVDILFSTDGGLTYPYTIVSGTSNDGSHVITIPNLITAAGRVRVQASNNVYFNINSAPITITSVCAANGTTFAPADNVTAPRGNAALDLALSPQYGTPVTISGQLAATDPATLLALNNNTFGSCISFGNQFRYDTYRFTVNVSGSYTFTRSGTTHGATIFNIYSNVFTPSNPCTGFLGSNGTYVNPPGNVPPPAASYSINLNAGIYYTMAVGTFGAGSPPLPSNYTIDVTPPAGGGLYTGPVDPGAGFSYTYVIVDNTTGNIKAIDAGSDLTNTATYPAGTYQVYGMSYDNTIAPATLNSYVNGPFTTLQNDLLYSPGTICGNLSNNSITVTVLTLAPVQFTKLEAFRSNHTVQLQWGTVTEQNAAYFEAERSADGINFSRVIGKVQAKGNSSVLQQYSLVDLNPLAAWNYYRVKQYDIDGHVLVSNVARVMMQPEGNPVVVYPNPVRATLTVGYTSQQSMPVELVVFDSKGSKAGSWKFNASAGMNRFTIPVRSLLAGQYTLQLVSKDGTSNARFVKN